MQASYKRKQYISENEEIRNGFKVSANRKKVWNIQLGLLEELKRICKKHDIKYYADCGTLLGAVRHKGFIPRDDDMDFVMFYSDYDKFVEIANNELPENIRLREHYAGFLRLVNVETSAFWKDNRRDDDFKGGIWIDIFPMNYASKYKIINRLKHKFLGYLAMILSIQNAYGVSDKLRGWKKAISKIGRCFFKHIDYKKIYSLHQNLNRKVFFRGNNVYHLFNTFLFYPKDVYRKSIDMEFENTSIKVPYDYDTWLKIDYGDYMNPIINKGGHNCRYSTDKSYKDIIKTFDKSKSNEENYKNCKDLFVLD